MQHLYSPLASAINTYLKRPICLGIHFSLNKRKLTGIIVFVTLVLRKRTVTLQMNIRIKGLFEGTTILHDEIHASV